MQEQKMNAVRNELMRVKDAPNGPRIRQCEERFTQLVGDIFIGNEMVPDVIETPPRYPLELTYRLVVTHWKNPKRGPMVLKKHKSNIKHLVAPDKPLVI